MKLKIKLVRQGEEASGSADGGRCLPFVGCFAGDPCAQRRLKQVSFKCFEKGGENDPVPKKGRKKKRTASNKRQRDEDGGLPARKIQATSKALLYEGNANVIPREQHSYSGGGRRSDGRPNLRYAIGVLDNDSQIIHVLPTDPRLICLQQRLRPRVAAKLMRSAKASARMLTGSRAGDVIDQGTNNTTSATNDSYKKRQDLTEAFGSRKSRNAMRSAEHNRFVMAHVAGREALTEHLESARVKGEGGSIASPGMSLADTASAIAREARLPPFIASESDPSEAYPWSKFITTEERVALRPAAEKLVKDYNADSPVLDVGTGMNTLTTDLLEDLPEVTVERAMQALYLECILFLTGAYDEGNKKGKGEDKSKNKSKNKSRNKGRRRVPRGPINDVQSQLTLSRGVGMPFARLFLLRFKDEEPTKGKKRTSSSNNNNDNDEDVGRGGVSTDNPTNSRITFSSVRTLDRLCAHAAVLSLMLGGWSCKVKSLGSALGLSVSVAKTYLRDVGCRFSLVKGKAGRKVAVAHLVTPLQKSFPRIRRARRAS